MARFSFDEFMSLLLFAFLAGYLAAFLASKFTLR
jgi:hypothetical protein